MMNKTLHCWKKPSVKKSWNVWTDTWYGMRMDRSNVSCRFTIEGYNDSDTPHIIVSQGFVIVR